MAHPAQPNEELFMVPLVERPDLFVQCISLLNEEWPRSFTIRENSLNKTRNLEPPMSLLYVNADLNELIGYGKLCSMLTSETDCWVESVVVRKIYRNRGFGRQLMIAIEQFAIQFNFKKVHLCTTDKHKFYEKCGYSFCEPVQHIGANINLFKSRNIQTLWERSLEENVGVKGHTERVCKKLNLETDQSSDKTTTSIISVERICPPHIRSTPPIPPCISALDSFKCKNMPTEHKFFMCKMLS